MRRQFFYTLVNSVFAISTFVFAVNWLLAGGRLDLGLEHIVLVPDVGGNELYISKNKERHKQPYARWKSKQNTKVVDRHGKVIPNTSPDKFSDLLLVIGVDDASEISIIADTLDLTPELKKRVTTATRISGRRWNVTVDKNVDVFLPEIGFKDAWTQLAEIEEELGMMRERDIAVVDLRFPDRLVVRTSKNTR